MKKWVLISIICSVVSLVSLLSCLKKSDIPIVTTTVAEIKTTSAIMGGDVIDDGGAKVDAVGVCWGTDHNPDKSNATAYYRKGDTGPFTFIVPTLTPGTYYHARAFASNYIGTAYGDEIDFITKMLIKPEAITMLNTSSVSYSSAEAGGLIKGDDDSPVFERGICLSTKPNSASADQMISGGVSTGLFTCKIWDLKPETVFYIRAYARYLGGIIYGEEMNFKTKVFPFITLPVASITRTTAKVAGKYILENYPDDWFIWLYGWNEGICYGTSPSPTIRENFVVADSIQSDSVFVCTLLNLSPATRYYVRAFRHFESEYPNIPAYDEYANEITFTTAR